MPAHTSAGSDQVTLVVEGGRDGDELLALRTWLSDVEQLRGRVELVRPPVKPGELGAVMDTLVVALGPAGAVAALVGALGSWLRHRGASVRVTIEGSTGRRIALDAQRVKRLDAAELSELAGELSRLVEEPPAEAPDRRDQA